MSELDPRLAELLRRAPPPPAALDDAHRAAIAAAARQAWFRQRARARRSAWTFAAAACLTAGLAGWMLRAGLEGATMPAAQTMATSATPGSHAPLSAAPEPLVAADAFSERRSLGPMPARPLAVAAPMEEAAAVADDLRREQDAGAMRDATAGNAAAPAAKPAAPPAATTGFASPAMAMESKVAAAELEVPAAAAAPAPMAKRARADAGMPIAVPADAPQRGRLLAAAAVLDAVHSQRLAPADRAAALRAALDGLDGIAHPAAEDLRRRLRAALTAP